MNCNYKQLTQKLDLCGQIEREGQRIQKQEQAPQQLDVAQAVRRGLHSYLAESYRRIDMETLKRRDPAAYFFLTSNRDPSSA